MPLLLISSVFIHGYLKTLNNTKSYPFKAGLLDKTAGVWRLKPFFSFLPQFLLLDWGFSFSRGRLFRFFDAVRLMRTLSLKVPLTDSPRNFSRCNSMQAKSRAKQIYNWGWGILYQTGASEYLTMKNQEIACSMPCPNNWKLLRESKSYMAN